MLSLFVLAPASVVLTAVLVFAAIGPRDRLDQGNRTQRPTRPTKSPETAKKRPRKAQGRPRGRPRENIGRDDKRRGQRGIRPRETQREGRDQGAETRYYLELSDVCRSYRFVYVLLLIYLSVVLSLEPVY